MLYNSTLWKLSDVVIQSFSSRGAVLAPSTVQDQYNMIESDEP